MRITDLLSYLLAQFWHLSHQLEVLTIHHQYANATPVLTTSVNNGACGFIGLLGHGGLKRIASIVSTTAGTKWKHKSAASGGRGRSGGMTSEVSTRRNPQYKIDITISIGAATRER
jgi:hypothetical protein